ncbi:MAG: glycoside hydrolase family 32 protein [Chloroflexota bacterium]
MMKNSNVIMDLSEPLRPLLHFSVPKNWMNDPNGMVFYKGEYHLFYQYYPDDTKWGPMHWGHAVSPDMVNWTHLPIALYPDELGYIFSGGAVIDWHNTAGFGEEAMIAFYTYHDPDSEKQSQALAYSVDNGRSWIKYQGNPIIPTPPNLQNFRDPKVIWYDAGNGAGHWVMLIAAGNAIQFYTSSDMVNWERKGRFGFGQGAATGVWETPDMFELSIDGGAETRWVLTVGLGAGAPAGGSGMQYFVGQFNGYEFVNDNSKETVLWADYGADFYAAQSWSDTLDGRQLWLAWMNNWQYATQIPTSTWRGAMSLPREVGLTETEKGYQLVQKPIAELQQLRVEHFAWQMVTIPIEAGFKPNLTAPLMEIVAIFEVDAAVDQFGFRLVSDDDAYTAVGYRPKNRHLFVDRSQAGLSNFHEAFGDTHLAEYRISNQLLRFHMFVDSSAFVLFVDEGLVTFNERVFPTNNQFSLHFFSENKSVILKSLDVYLLSPAQFFVEAAAE